MAQTSEIDKTILYCTDHSLNPWLFETCQRLLVEHSCGCPIVSVSQKPMDFGENVCVGPIGRSGISLDIQLLEGLKRIRTKWVMVGEHDCVYSEEHVRWIPPDDKYFWYNDNQWLAQYSNPRRPEWNGMFSHWRKRRVQSQLICNTALYLEAQALKVEIVTDLAWRAKYPSGRVGEPGCSDFRRTMRLSRPLEVRHLRGKVYEYLTKYECKMFLTTVPIIDIRHETNYTGPRRGRNRTYVLPPWGRLEDVLGGKEVRCG